MENLNKAKQVNALRVKAAKPARLKAIKPEKYVRGLNKRDVAKHLFNSEIKTFMENERGGKPGVGKKFIGEYSTLLKKWMDGMSEEQQDRLNKTYKEWNEQGLPPDLQHKYTQILLFYN